MEDFKEENKIEVEESLNAATPDAEPTPKAQPDDKLFDPFDPLDPFDESFDDLFDEEKYESLFGKKPCKTKSPKKPRSKNKKAASVKFTFADVLAVAKVVFVNPVCRFLALVLAVSVISGTICVNSYKSSLYEEAESCKMNRDWFNAAVIYEQLGSYKDSKLLMDQCLQSYVSHYLLNGNSYSELKSAIGASQDARNSFTKFLSESDIYIRKDDVDAYFKGLEYFEEGSYQVAYNYFAECPELSHEYLDKLNVVCTKSVDDENGEKVENSYSYDNKGHLTSLVKEFADGSKKTISYEYTYNSDGSVRSVTRKGNDTEDCTKSMKFKYDKYGNVCNEVIEYIKDGKSFVKETGKTFDEKGTYVKNMTVSSSETGLTEKTEYFYSVWNDYKVEKEITKIYSRSDESVQLGSRKTTYTYGELESLREVNIVDGYNNTKEVRKYSSKDDTTDVIKTTITDAKGQKHEYTETTTFLYRKDVIRSVEYKTGKKVTKLIEFTYKDKDEPYTTEGALVDSVSITENGKTTKTEYGYDSNGTIERVKCGDTKHTITDFEVYCDTAPKADFSAMFDNTFTIKQ